METSLGNRGHTCTDLGIPVAGEVEEKEELKSLSHKWRSGRKGRTEKLVT